VNSLFAAGMRWQAAEIRRRAENQKYRGMWFARANPSYGQSPVLLYEDDVQLGPAHCTHTDVARLGKGRFSHWRNVGVVFIILL
jgi:hypothetical protein